MEAIEQDLLRGFTTRDARLLRETVRRAIAQDTHQCILHPLGFYLTRLAARGETTVRLHYWPVGARQKGTAITPYHDHVWSLLSCILAGTIENVLLELHPDPSGEYQIATIDQVGVVDNVIPASARVRIESQSSDRYGVGRFYDIPPRVFHCTNVPFEEPTITVVQASVVAPGGPRTLLPLESQGHMPTREAVADSTRIFREIDDILAV
jgi:hypothetical protein